MIYCQLGSKGEKIGIQTSLSSNPSLTKLEREEEVWKGQKRQLPSCSQNNVGVVLMQEIQRDHNKDMYAWTCFFFSSFTHTCKRREV